MSPIFTSGLPLVRSINALSLTKSKESIGSTQEPTRAGTSVRKSRKNRTT